MNRFLWVLFLMLFCSSCFVVSHNKFTLYKQVPLEYVEVTPELEGYYYLDNDLAVGLIFLLKNGRCLFIIWNTPADEHSDSLARRNINLTKTQIAWRINRLGHYVITGNKIKLEFYEEFPGLAIRWNISKSEGIIIDSQTIHIKNKYCEWKKDSICPHFSGMKNFSPPLEFKFHPYDLSGLDSIHPFFVKKRWYQKNVWYNNKSR